MQLRRVSGPGLAFLLAAGIGGGLRAQEIAEPQGILIRVDRPAAGAWAGIGDSIGIRVLAYDGILDEGFRVSVADASVRDEDVGVTAGGAVSRGFVYYNIYIPNPADLPPGVAFGDSEASGVDTFRVSIAVSPRGTAFESKDGRSAKVVVDLDASTSGNELNNLMTKWKITPASSGFGAGRVGDGVRFGIDANRPVHADVFKSFRVEADNLSFDTTQAGLIRRVRFGIGDEITIGFALNVAGMLNAGTSRIRVGVVETDSAFSTAPVSFEFAGDRLYRANLRASKRVQEGNFADNRRVRVEAYLSDAAGNLGGASMDAQTASPVSAGHGLPGVFDPDGVEWIADAAPPRIAIVHPHPDSLEDRISAAFAQTLTDYRPLPGETSDVQASRWLKPLEFSLSEVPDSIRITHGDSAHGIGSSAEDAAPTGGDSTATLGLPWKYDIAGGVRDDLKIEVWDSLGNASSITLTGIWYDEKAPVIGNLFPSEASAPRDPDNLDEPTINLAGKDPVFTIDEELASLSVRYIETGGVAAVAQRFGAGNHRLETIGELVSWPVEDTGFYDRHRYYLQILAVDLAGNASLTEGGTFTFSRGFLNPGAGAFRLTALPDQEDAVVAGRDYVIRIAALDTTLTRIEGADVLAATYSAPAALAVIVSGEQAAALEGVSFSGRGVSPAPSFLLPADLAAAGMVARAAILDGQGWHAGRRDVALRSTRPISGAMVMAAEYAIDPATGAHTLRISGRLVGLLNVEVAELSKFVVAALEGEVPGGSVAGGFTVNVLPADAFGNASMKIDNSVGSETYESVVVTFSSSHAAVTVPSGVQTVPAGGADFGAVAAAMDGSATIAVRTVARDLVTGTDDDAVTGAFSGSVTVSFAPEGGTGPLAPAAPASIEVQDYLGADGRGDQGGLVLIGFPKPAGNDDVIRYLIEREIETTLVGYDEDGNEVHGEAPVKRWMHWGSIGPAAGSIGESGDSSGAVQRVVIPALDNSATRWGVRSVGSGGSSDAPAAGKRVVTRESVRRTLRLLGIPPGPVLPDGEPTDRFNAPNDFPESVIGDSRVLLFAPADPNVSAMAGCASVPENIRMSSSGVLLVSARTVTAEPVRAVDNIAPAAATGATGEGAGTVALRWTPSADDRSVGYWPFRGYNIPIPGVKGYRVMRGVSADDLKQVASLPSGSTRFEDGDLPDGATSLLYRIDAFDDDNLTPGQWIAVNNISVRARFVDAGGNPVYLIVLPSHGGTLEVDFEDLVAFAKAFGSRRDDANYDPQADVNDDGAVDFSDFLTASSSFGRTAAPAAGKLAVVPRRPGANAHTEMALELTGERVLAGETISLTVSIANARQLNGFGLELAYDADKFEFVSAGPAGDDLLKSEGGETPLFRIWPEAGRVSAVNAIVESGSVGGEGPLSTFTFRVLRAFEGFGRFEIAQGVVFDADQLRNPVATLGALDLKSTPSESALHQNHPNPFNPETGIPYDLAEGGDVVLKIYNLLGQEVRTLVSEPQAPGRYTEPWNGTDDRGVPVSSGVYFYQITVTGGFQDARRLILIR